MSAMIGKGASESMKFSSTEEWSASCVCEFVSGSNAGRLFALSTSEAPNRGRRRPPQQRSNALVGAAPEQFKHELSTHPDCVAPLLA